MDAVSARGAGATVQSWAGSKAALFLLVAGTVLAVDIVTKLAVQESLHLYQQVPVIGDYVRLTLHRQSGSGVRDPSRAVLARGLPGAVGRGARRRWAGCTG